MEEIIATLQKWCEEYRKEEEENLAQGLVCGVLSKTSMCAAINSLRSSDFLSGTLSAKPVSPENQRSRELEGSRDVVKGFGEFRHIGKNATGKHTPLRQILNIIFYLYYHQ